MVISNQIRNITTLIMFVLVVNMIAGNYYLQREFLEPLKERMGAVTLSFFADDSGELGIGDYKPPKNSYVKYESLFRSSSLMIAYLPETSRLDFAEPSGTVQVVYADIIVPPKISPHKTITYIA